MNRQNCVPHSLSLHAGSAAHVREHGLRAAVLDFGFLELGELEPLTHRELGWGIDPPMGKRGPVAESPWPDTSASGVVPKIMLLISFYTFLLTE